MDQYGVIGNPIAQSKSPWIHQQFAQQTHQALTYQAILTDLDSFAQTVDAFRKQGGKGLNVTIPFKQEAWNYCTERTANAELSGAVNTLIFKDGQVLGANTDGIGLVRDLRNNHEIQLEGQSILLLGAGGAVRGVLPALCEAKPASILIANRTLDKAQHLAQLFTSLGKVDACAYTALAGKQFDLIINGTSASLQDQLPPLPDGILRVNGACYDMMYRLAPTAFVEWGHDQKANISVDGFGMLVEQAAESFYCWRGVRPDTGAVISEFLMERMEP